MQAFSTLTRGVDSRYTAPCLWIALEVIPYEEDLAADVGAQAEAAPRVSTAHADVRGPGGDPPAPAQGPVSTDPLIDLPVSTQRPALTTMTEGDDAGDERSDRCGGAVHRLAFRRSQRLTSGVQFQRVYAQGLVTRGSGVVVRLARQMGESPLPARVGISIRRTAVRTNVARNRWKRWIREVFRHHPDAVAPGCDVVVSVTQPPHGWGYREVEAALLALFAQASAASQRAVVGLPVAPAVGYRAPKVSRGDTTRGGHAAVPSPPTGAAGST